MRRFFALSLLALPLAMAACSESSTKNAAEQVTTTDIREEAAMDRAAPAVPGMAPPAISVSAAPGVAFAYRYAFVLPDTAIAGVQERHAAACEALGIARCRITGMHYRLVDNDSVAASLSFKLAPDLARAFGKDGIITVEKAAGKLVDAAIEGSDVGTDISNSQVRSAGIADEISRIETRLRSDGLSGGEKVELRRQIETLRQQQAGERDTRVAGEARLANTPMEFHYTGGRDFRFAGDPFHRAAHASWESLSTLIGAVLLAIGVGLPWALLALALLLAWRTRPVRWLRNLVSPPHFRLRPQPDPAPGPSGEDR